MYELKMREIREARGLNQEQLAELIGENRQKVGAWEREDRKLPLDVACRISAALRCSVDELCGMEQITSTEDRYIMDVSDDGTVTFKKEE